MSESVRIPPVVFRMWRRCVGFSQAQAAEVMGVTVRSYRRWEAQGLMRKVAEVQAQMVASLLLRWPDG